jgi:hypothetical protein
MVSLSKNLSLVTVTPVVVVVVAGKGRAPSQAHLCENGCTGRRTIVLFGTFVVTFVGTIKTNVQRVCGVAWCGGAFGIAISQQKQQKHRLFGCGVIADTLTHVFRLFRNFSPVLPIYFSLTPYFC